MKRRTFISQLALGSAGTVLPPLVWGCAEDKKAAITGSPPFNVWEQMTEALGSSADHYYARREQSIAAKDLQAMFELVQRDILLLPSDDNYFNNPDSGQWYGATHALRSGMATPREKAEMLASMMQEAGYEARVVLETADLTEEEVKNILFSFEKPPFNPDISEKDIAAWRSELGASPENGEVRNIPEDNSGKDFAKRLGSQLKDAGLVNDKASRFLFRKNKIPTVAYKEGGETKYAHIFDPSVPLGQLHPKNTNQETREAPPISEKKEEITLRLTTSLSDSNEESELLKASYELNDLIGSRLHVNFLNNMTFEEQLVHTISDINSFTPSIAIENVNKDRKWHEDKSYLGDAIDLGGRSITKNTEIVSGNPDNNTSDMAAQVASLDIEVKPLNYPLVSVNVFPKDPEGKIVAGLLPGDFTIADNNTQRRAFMKQNRITPRILVLYDTSASMPEAYSQPGMENFIDRLQDRIQQQYEYCRFQLQPTKSYIYSSLNKAMLADADLIIYATDGHNRDNFKESYKETYRQGPKCLFLNVHDESHRSFQTLEENTGAIVIPAKDQETAMERINAVLNELDLPPYRFSYTSDKPEEKHELKVEIPASGLSATAAFVFETDPEYTGNLMTGLHLYIEFPGGKVIKRTLAGKDPDRPGIFENERKAFQDVHEQLLGSLCIGFEREGTSLSVRLSEYLQSLVSNKNWFSAFQEDEIEKAMEEIQKGRFQYPSLFLTMFQPLEDLVTQNSITFPRGIRCGIQKFKPGLYKETTELSFDFLPTTDYLTLTRSGKNGFEVNLEKTAQLSLLESMMFEESALSRLGSKNLVTSRTYEKGEKYSARTLGDRYPFFREHLIGSRDITLFDRDLGELSYWKVNYQTGEVYGMLYNGTGGGQSDYFAQLYHLQNIVKGYEELIAKMNVASVATGVGGSLPLGVVANYSVTLVRLYALASTAIIVMDTTGMYEAIRAEFAQLACAIYKEIVYGALGIFGEVMNGVENLISLAGGNFSFISCDGVG